MCAVIGCLLINLVMLIDCYRSMIERFASPATKGLSHRFFLSLVSSLRGERKPLGPGYCMAHHVQYIDLSDF